MIHDDVYSPVPGTNEVIIGGAPPQPSRHHAVRVVKRFDVPSGGEAYFDLPGVTCGGIGPQAQPNGTIVWKAYFQYAPQPDPFPVPPGATVRVIVE